MELHSYSFISTLSDDSELDVDQENESDLQSDELLGQENGDFSTLMSERHRKIDCAAVSGVNDQQGIFSHDFKEFMINMLTESYQNLHLSEALQEVGEEESEDQDEEESSLISSHHALQHSETDTMRMQLAEPEQHLITAKEEKVNVCAELQKKLCDYENMVQSLQLEVKSSQHCIQSLRDHLHQSEDSVQSLKLELKEKQEKIHLLNQNLFSADKNLKFIQTDLYLYKDFSYTLQQQLIATEEENEALQEALMACKARVHEAEKEKQQECESKEECESKIRNMLNILKDLNNCIEHSMIDLHGQLKMALKREESLKRTVEQSKTKRKAEVPKLQHGLNGSKRKL